MLFFSLLFLLGDVFLQTQLILPSTAIILCAALCASLLLMSDYRRYVCILGVAGFFLGFAWAGWYSYQLLHWELPREWEGKPLVVTGKIDSLPVVDKFGTHFIFALDDLRNQNLHVYGKSKIRLSWQAAKPLRVGDQFELMVRLKRLHGMRNPGGFDYEAWALENGFRASGSVITSVSPKKLSHDYLHAPVNQVRQQLQHQILRYLPQSSTSIWLLALMLGERSGTPAEHWKILRATGTNHLMAIAGLHIGLISGMVYFFVKILWRRSQYLIVCYPVPLAASVGALSSAWLYSALAGFSIPTQRACIMLSFFLTARLLRRQLPAWHAWAAALMVVLLINPLAVLSESFWLSFGTIALIIYGMSGRLAPSGWWWKWGRVQWVIGFGLLPFSLLFFQQTSLVSVIANTIAIPWLGFLILPFCFFSTLLIFIFPSFAAILLWLADKSLAGLWIVLSWFAQLDYAVWTQAISTPFIFLVTVLACLFLLAPAGAPGRWLGALWLLPVMLIKADVPVKGDFWVSVLDVGQGLSVVVQTNKHTLLFDTGPRFGSQFDMGESVVVPYLYSAGIKRIDTMMISHGDNDHIGGAFAVMQHLPVTQILTSAVDKFPSGMAQLCLAGTEWEWDGIHFKIMYPFSESLTLNNDSSCVIKIDNGKHSVLLTGDIEKFAEKKLLATYSSYLHADLMTAPHHGSKTSSQHAFVKAVNPQYVVYATGYRNRYHFPHLAVTREYESAGVLAFNTAEAGDIQVKLTQDVMIQPVQYRIAELRYWHD